jgi:hypothetical protein
MNLLENDMLLISRALYWYQNTLENRLKDANDTIELENVKFLRQCISDNIKRIGCLS